MDVSFVAPDLRSLDGLKSEALSVPLFSDERPLRGTLGLVDWRLAGLVSRVIASGRLSGTAGETILVPARPKLTFEKLFVFGLGPRAAFDDVLFEGAVERMLLTLTRARVKRSVLVLPGRPFDAITPARAMELFLRVASRHEEHDHVTLVDDAEAERAMVPVVERERRRARALGA